MIVGPLSVLPNWVSEVERWCPTLPVVLYHGSRQERAELRARHMPFGRFMRCWGCQVWQGWGFQTTWAEGFKLLFLAVLAVMVGLERSNLLCLTFSSLQYPASFPFQGCCDTPVPVFFLLSPS